MSKVQSATTAVTVQLPQQLADELMVILEEKAMTQDEFFSTAAKSYIREQKIRQTRDSIRDGYIEMAKINLNLASEAFHAESEADQTVERMVSGG